jgi:hypothetical protein
MVLFRSMMARLRSKAQLLLKVHPVDFVAILFGLTRFVRLRQEIWNYLPLQL